VESHLTNWFGFLQNEKWCRKFSPLPRNGSWWNAIYKECSWQSSTKDRATQNIGLEKTEKNGKSAKEWESFTSGRALCLQGLMHPKFPNFLNFTKVTKCNVTWALRIQAKVSGFKIARSWITTRMERSRFRTKIEKQANVKSLTSLLTKWN